MATSPSKRKISDADEPNVRQSGRVRKPKVFYDPSDSTKRRSLPNMETTKPKKSAKFAEPEPQSETYEKKQLEKVMSNPEKSKREPAVTPAPITNRRKTVCSVPLFDDGTGCIVCGRSDTKKGRFVQCIDCIKRGHFTCLRNDKIFKTADQELNWQCPSCKICEYCNKTKSSEQLYKCNLCLNSYHLHCSAKISPLPKSVVKKKFMCGFCTKGSATVKSIESTKPALPHRKSEGFPGFAHEETKKLNPKPNVGAKIKKTVSFPTERPAAPSKQTAKDQKDNKKISSDLDFKMEMETSDHESIPMESYGEHLSPESVSKQTTISVRTDLVVPTKTDAVDPKLEIDDDQLDIKYDSHTIIKPHESIPDVRKWDCDEVFTYFMGKETPDFAKVLKDNQIDGDALLLIKRDDVLNRFNLKLGQSLRLYSHIVSLQYKNNNPILAWNEF